MLTNFTLEDEKSLRQWLKDVREGAGYLGILDQEGWFQKHFNDNEELLALLDQYKSNCNLYVSMACYESPAVKRTQENATKLCSFWLDLDSHGGGKYEVPDQAIDDLERFVSSILYPAPATLTVQGMAYMQYGLLR